MSKANKDRDLTFADQKIIDIGIEREVKKSFIEYAMSVITARALPDARDGLKPVHRRVLYAMYEDHLTYDNPYRKSATTVGDVLGRYHPHGDSAVYDTMVRMAQDFSMRYTLIDGQGNFGNLDGDQAAAYRYTEARMSRIANDMLTDIDKKVVDFVPSFDNKREEPSVLPARFPNLLVNGTMGIAVGMATNIPPHNLGETIDGTIALMENPDLSVTDIMQYIKGPDFPTGATIYGMNGILSAYTTGHGSIMVRANAQVDEDKHQIIITEIPYAVNKAAMVQEIAQCHKDKKVDGITELRDVSGKEGVKIIIDYRRDANGQVILNQLYKYTQMQSTFACNMLALVDGRPEILNLKQLLQVYIDHQKDVIVRKTKFELAKAEHDAHINEGYKIAIDNIDEVIEIIKTSASIPDAKAKLSERFELSDEQAQAIVDMTLGRLSGLERQKVEERLAALYAKIEELKGILADEHKVQEIIKEDMLAIKNRFGDERRTKIEEAADEIMPEDLIKRHLCAVTMSNSGYIKRLPTDSFEAQGRGGKGVIGMKTKEEDFVIMMETVDSHSYLLLFTNRGKVFTKKAYEIPEASRTAKGTHIANVLPLEEGEKVTSMFSIENFEDKNLILTMVTMRGVIKRTRLSEYENSRKGGKIAINLDEGDELLFVRCSEGEGDIILTTHNGYAVRFAEKDARIIGRTGRGVRGIKLTEGDFVVGCILVEDDKKMLTVTENGYGKKVSFDEYNAHSRGTKGVTCQKINDKTGKLCGVASVSDGDDIMLITNEGNLIRIHTESIPEYSRTAGGVIIMRMAGGAKIVNFSKVDREAEEEQLADEEVSGQDNDNEVVSEEKTRSTEAETVSEEKTTGEDE